MPLGLYIFIYFIFFYQSKALEDAALSYKNQMDTMLFSDILQAKGFIN